MGTILGLDLGEFKCVACPYDPDTTQARFTTVPTDPQDPRKFLEAGRPGTVLFETCTIAGWVADTCANPGLAYIIADPVDAERAQAQAANDCGGGVMRKEGFIGWMMSPRGHAC